MQVTILDAPNDGPCSGVVLRGWLPDLRSEFSKVLISCVKSVPTFDLRSDCDLQQLRRGEVAAFQLGIETVGKVDLNSRHTHNHTPSGSIAKPRSATDISADNYQDDTA